MNQNPYHIKGTNDHWWPVGVQKFWANDTGYLSRIDRNGNLECKKPSSKKKKRGFASTYRGHEISFGVSPWNMSFEANFDDIDGKAVRIISQLSHECGVSCYNVTDSIGMLISAWRRQRGLRFRSKNLILTEGYIDDLIRLILSLLIRSPAFRKWQSARHAAFGGGYDPELGKYNIYQYWRSANGIESFAAFKPVILVYHATDGNEFIYGDGAFDEITPSLHQLRPVGDSWAPCFYGQCLLSITPRIAVFIAASKHQANELKTLVIDLVEPEVEEINEIIEISSHREIFFSSKKPNVLEFPNGQGYARVDISTCPFVMESIRFAMSYPGA